MQQSRIKVSQNICFEYLVTLYPSCSPEHCFQVRQHLNAALKRHCCQSGYSSCEFSRVFNPLVNTFLVYTFTVYWRLCLPNVNPHKILHDEVYQTLINELTQHAKVQPTVSRIAVLTLSYEADGGEVVVILFLIRSKLKKTRQSPVFYCR